MNKTLTTKSSNNRIINFLMIMALGVWMMSGCGQPAEPAKNATNTATNTTTNNSTANANANTNANSNITANSNANANTSASNTATAAKEEKPLTAEEQEFKNTLVGEWKNDKMTVTFTEKEFSSKMNDGTVNAGPYRIVDEQTIEGEVTRLKAKFKATMSFEDDGKTLNWSDPTGKFKYTRVK